MQIRVIRVICVLSFIMPHFAYPNVKLIGQTFIGCGRYIAAENPPGEEYNDLATQNITKKISELQTAAEILISDSVDTKKQIWEKKDLPHETYAGHSQNLAYLLALISRFREVKFEPLQGDIWCTGTVTMLEGKHPFLEAVDPGGFGIKLEAFLFEENTDTLFIVPAAVIHPSHEAFLTAQNTALNVISLTQFKRYSVQEISERKTILKVRGDELKELVNILFEKSVDKEIAPNPYRGLYAFREEDADVFFGRERFTDKLVEAVQHYPVVLVIGASGSGKSSVASAGLKPRLRKQGDWLITHFSPGENPLDTLAGSFESLLKEIQDGRYPLKNVGTIRGIEDDVRNEIEGMIPVQSSPSNPFADVKKAIQVLRCGESGARKIVEGLLEHTHYSRFLIIADQFEELYTLCRDKTLRQQFLHTLLQTCEVSQTSQVSFRLVITLRADFLGKALSDPSLSVVIQDSFEDEVRLESTKLLLGAMTLQELNAAIEEPAAKLGVKIEEGLTDRILDAVAHEPGNLPLLEFALTLLWKYQTEKTLTNSAYKKIGGVEKALALYAESWYTRLTSKDQNRAQQIFVQLVQPGEGTEDTRRVANRNEIGAENWNVVTTTLTSSRLVVTADSEASGETVTLVHEALIREWERLQEWSVAFNPDGTILATSGNFGITLWNVSNRAKVATLQGHFGSVETITFSPDGTMLASGSWDKSIRLWNIADNKELVKLQGHSGKIHSICFSPDGKILASASDDMSIRLWNISDKKEIITLKGHSASVHSVMFSPDGLMLASGSKDKTVKFWNVADGKEFAILEGHSKTIFSIILSSNGKVLVSRSLDKTIKLWNVVQNQESSIFKGHTDSVWSVAFSPDGKILASGSSDKTIKLWDIPNGRELTTFQGHTDSVWSVAFSPDSKLLASGSKDKTVKLWNITDSREIMTLHGHSGFVYSVAFSPDGRMLASGYENNTVKFWNVVDGREILTLQGHTDRVDDITFSSDGKILASGSWDKTIKLWNVADGRIIMTLQGHTDLMHGVAFSPDDMLLASGGNDKSVRLWSVSDGKEIAILHSYFEPVSSVAFSPDNRFFVSGSQRGTVILWNLNLDDLLMRGCEWLQGYLKNNSNVSDEDRCVCDDILENYKDFA